MGARDLNFSCPAVSQSWRRTGPEDVVITFVKNAAPIVAGMLRSKVPCTKRDRTHDFPTLVSPTKTTFRLLIFKKTSDMKC